MPLKEPKAGVLTEQPGHEYTKQNVKFLVTVIQTEAVKKLQSYAENNEQTQGKFTIGDEKVDSYMLGSYLSKADPKQEYNVFMKVNVSDYFWSLKLDPG